MELKVMQVFNGFVSFLYQIIVSIFGLSNKPDSTELQSQDSQNQEKFLTRAQKNSVDFNKQNEKNLQGQPINKRAAVDETVQLVAPEQSEVSIYAAELQNRKKRCQICRRSSTKQQKFDKGKSLAEETEDINKEITDLQHKLWHQVDAQEKVPESNTKAILTDLRNDREMQERIMGFQFSPSGNRASDHLSNIDASGIVTPGDSQDFAAATEKRHKDIDCISKDASDAIKTIEFLISALKGGSKHVCSCVKQTETQQGVFKFAAGSVSGVGTSSLNTGKNAGLVSQGDRTHLGQFVLGIDDSHIPIVGRRARETKGLSRWRQLSKYVMNPINELKFPDQSVRNSTSLSPWTVEPSKSLCENSKKDSVIALGGNTFSQVDKLIEGKKFGLHKASPIHVQNVKTNEGKANSMTRNMKNPSRTNSIQSVRIPLNEDKKNSLLEKFPRKTKKLVLDGNQVAQKNELKNVGKTKSSISVSELTNTQKPERKFLAVRAGNKHIQTRSKMSVTSKGLPHQTNMRQTLQDEKHDQFMVYPVRHGDQIEKCRSKNKNKIKQKGQQRILSDQQESYGSSSSSWTTQQGSTSYSVSEEYSVTDQNQSDRHFATISSSESKGRYVTGSAQSHNSGYTSYSESESSSVPNSPQSLEDSNSSSENVCYLPYDQTSSLSSRDPSCRHERFSRSYRSTNRKRPKIQTGRLKKLKDKLAIIFHHHHHHHHHADDSTDSDDQAQAYLHTPLSKNAAKMFSRRNQTQSYGEKAAEKLSKSMVRNVPNNKQGANFNKLVHGFVRHVRHSKKSKKSKNGIEKKTKNQHEGKKLAKKVHWWKFLHRRPQRMKMPKKRRVKLGFGIKKSKLQAVPTIKWR